MKKSQLKEFIKSSLMNEKTLDEARISPDNRVTYLEQTLDYVWNMGKGNNTIDFKFLAQSLINDMFDEESLGEAEDTQLEKTAKDAAIKAEQAKIKAAQEKITNLNKGLQNENEDEEEGIDVSMDKVSKALSAVQKKLDQMFADFKMGKMNKDEYMSKRKDLQAKRDKLNAALMSFEEDEDEI
jgi:chromosome segregation ATPase